MRYKFNISYDGTDYAGWQIQPNAMTIQELIESNISLLEGESINIVGCGRTDAGVHASDYYFHVDLNNKIGLGIEDYKYKLNTMLPQSIAIKGVEIVGEEFHARFSALRRSYTYFIHFDKDPYQNLYSYHCPFYDRIDIADFNKVAQLLPQYSEFDTFLKTKSDANTSKCEVYSAKWTFNELERTLRFDITADRYLRGMIRLIVGASINVSRGKLSVEDVKTALGSKSRLQPNWSAPAQGLFLSKVEY